MPQRATIARSNGKFVVSFSDIHNHSVVDSEHETLREAQARVRELTPPKVDPLRKAGTPKQK